MLNSLIQLLLKLLFRVEVRGLSNFYAAGNKVLILANHVSLLDSLIIKLFLPESVAYAIDEKAANKWWAKPFVNMLQYCVIDTRNPLSLKKLIDFLNQDNKILMFPEARISNTNSLMKVYQSTGLVLEKSDAMILPVYIDGSQYSLFSNLKGMVRRRLFPRITLNILAPRKMELPVGLKGQDKRDATVEYLTALLREMKFQSFDANLTLFQSLLKSKKQFGRRHKIIEDHKRLPLSYGQIIMRSILLGRYLKKETQSDIPVGVFLPTSVIATVIIYALHVVGRYPAMLNYGAGKKALLSCLHSADIKTVYTSHAFVEEGGLEELVNEISKVADIRYVEDIAGQLSSLDKLISYALSWFPAIYYHRQVKKPNADNTAVIIFTSGSEGLPKGVVLSHRNLLANTIQVSCILDFSFKDVLLNFLPMFHSFGLTAGTLLPMILGIRFFQYPSPLHYKVIPELAYEIDASIIFATNTFLAGYAQQAHRYDFHNIRLAFAGAEPLTEQVEKLWLEKFGIRILQGYGVTEASPVIAANTLLTYKKGTVGRFLPGMEYRLVDVSGIDCGKRLQVKGPNIMKGYLLANNPGHLVPPSTEEHGEGWYDTGDIVSVDDQGYMTICGRAKRFAKIAGEMVSLAVTENMVANAWAGYLHAVIARPDERKGEQLVLFTEYADAKKKALQKQAKLEGLNELYVPKEIQIVDHMPILASGKVDYVALKDLLDSSSA